MAKDKKMIVILIPGFPENEDDTTCLPLQQQLIRQLNTISPDLSPHVLSFQYPYSSGTYDWNGIPVTSFNGRNRGGLHRLLLRRKIKKSLKVLHKQNEIAGLLSFWYGECAWVGNSFAKKYGIPHFCWLRGQDARKENPYPARVKLKSGELIALSDFLRDEFEKQHKIRPQHLVETGTDLLLYQKDGAVKDLDIVAAGSLIPLKQYPVLLEILSLIKKQKPDLKAILIGSGPEEQKLKQLAADLDLGDVLTFIGSIPHTDVIQYMKRSKLFLHPSSYEGFSGVCVEALNSGCHVISFCKPMKENIRNWHIVNSNEEMTKKAIQLINDTTLVFDNANLFPISEPAMKLLRLFGI